MGVWTLGARIAFLAVALGTWLGEGIAEVRTSAVRGELFLAGKTPVDPPPDEARNSHAYLTITGPAAMRMYRAMKAPEEKNECLPGKLKNAGSLSCALSADGRSATCDFSIDLTRGTLEDGRPC